MAGGLRSGLGAGLQNFIETFYALKGAQEEKKRRALLDEQNAEQHRANMDAAGMQRQLAQHQLTQLPKDQALKDAANIRTTVGDEEAFNVEAYLDNLAKGGVTVPRKQVALPSSQILGLVKGPAIKEETNPLDAVGPGASAALKFGKPDVKPGDVTEAAEGGLVKGPLSTKQEIAGRAGVAPDTGAVLPKDVGLKAAQREAATAQARAIAELFNGKNGLGLNPEQRTRFIVSAGSGQSANDVLGPMGGGTTRTVRTRDDNGNSVVRLLNNKGEILFEAPDQIPQGQKKELVEVKGMREQIRDIRALGEQIGWKGMGGFGEGTVRSKVKQHTGIGSNAEDMVRSFVSNLNVEVAHEKFGSAFTSTEKSQLATFAPSQNMHKDVIKNRLAALERIFQIKEELLTNPNAPVPSITEVMKEAYAEEERKGLGKAPVVPGAPPAPGQVPGNVPPASGGKTATVADINAYAQRFGMTGPQAHALFVSKGYTIGQ